MKTADITNALEVANDLIYQFGNKATSVCDVVIADFTSYRVKPYLTTQQVFELIEYWKEVRNIIEYKTYNQ